MPASCRSSAVIKKCSKIFHLTTSCLWYRASRLLRHRHPLISSHYLEVLHPTLGNINWSGRKAQPPDQIMTRKYDTCEVPDLPTESYTLILILQVCCQHRENWLRRRKGSDPLSPVEPPLRRMVWLGQSLPQTSGEGPAAEKKPEWRPFDACKLTTFFLIVRRETYLSSLGHIYVLPSGFPCEWQGARQLVWLPFLPR